MSLSDRLIAGDTRALARALSLIENESPDAGSLLRDLYVHAGRAFVIGVTGPPGAGKSTLVDRLVTECRGQGSRVGVLAVDPSSPFTGGAILGDRVRMQAHADDAGVFIRSMATRGHLGGLARTTGEAAAVLDAAGFAVVIIETVGVGQAEIDIVRTAEISLVVVAPGAGDDVQALKAGIMEVGDVFVVNKADREGANRTAAAIEGMLSLRTWLPGDWRPPVVQTVATTGRGIAELMQVMAKFRQRATPEAMARRRGRVESMRSEAAASVALDHVGIAVRDASEMVSLFQSLFGLPTRDAEEIDAHRVRFVETGTTTLELVEPLSDESAVARFLAKRSSGLHHVCLLVSDLDATLARLKARGIRLVDEAARPGAHGSRIAFIHPSSTAGILIELKERRSVSG